MEDYKSIIDVARSSSIKSDRLKKILDHMSTLSIEKEEILADSDIFSVVGVNRPLLLVDSRSRKKGGCRRFKGKYCEDGLLEEVDSPMKGY
ncbi:hypothetical protein HanPSC8_Chr17g0757391 [Helianthus annuus]|nr:hypothetical protein HanPSC8_Chr17g0757391 [Helianthus annuus]